MDFNNMDSGHFSEEATIVTLFVLIIGSALPILQELSYIMAIILTSCTLFLNRKKYYEEFCKTELYKFIKNAIKKTTKR